MGHVLYMNQWSRKDGGLIHTPPEEEEIPQGLDQKQLFMSIYEGWMAFYGELNRSARVRIDADYEARMIVSAMHTFMETLKRMSEKEDVFFPYFTWKLDLAHSSMNKSLEISIGNAAVGIVEPIFIANVTAGCIENAVQYDIIEDLSGFVSEKSKALDLREDERKIHDIFMQAYLACVKFLHGASGRAEVYLVEENDELMVDIHTHRNVPDVESFTVDSQYMTGGLREILDVLQEYGVAYK